MALFEHIVRSEPMEIHFAGFRGTTYDLQRAGWRLAVHEDFHRCTIQLMARHEGAQLYLVADEARHNYKMRSTPGVREDLPVFVVRQVARALEMLRVSFDLASFGPVDAEPRWEEFKPRRIEDFALFGAPLVKTEEIIIEPQSVQECLDIIRRLQAPELAEIRKRNAQRERALEATKFHAQILTLAA